MAMYVKTEYDGFVAKVLITSDTVGEIDLLSKEFRIEIADQLKAFNYAGDLLRELGIVNSKEETEANKKVANEAINNILNDISYPIVKITKDNYQDYCNSDDESLWRNGMQFWVSSDRKSMSMRFIPKNTEDMSSKLACYKAPSVENNHGYWSKEVDEHGDPIWVPPKNITDGLTPSWCSLIVIVGFDNQNVTKFDLCLMPRLVTGPVEVSENNTNPEPVLSAASARSDYPFNGKEDIDYLYLNNADGHQTSAGELTPEYVVRSSAFISQDVAGANADELFNWNRFKSDLFDVNAKTGIPIPYTINGATDTSAVETPDPIDLEILPGHTLSGVYMYEINQYIDVSAMSGQDPITFAKNKVRLSVAI